MKKVKVEWCENFIKAFFKKHVPEGGGVYTGCFWDSAEKAGLWVRGTYGSPMSAALENLTRVETVHDSEGNFLYNVFKMKNKGGSIMKLNKEKFLKTEVGAELKSCIISWDKALDDCRKYSWETVEYKCERKVADWCQAQWEVYKIVLLQFFGVEYCFTRTDEYFGLVTKDGKNWLFKINRAA